ncbi:MAG: lipocalin-like domain-containing protein [Acidobacteriota bacterium]
MRIRNLAVLVLALAGASVAISAQSGTNAARQFVGHWRLISFENFDEKGVARRAEYDGGRIMYDAAGQMSAQLMQSGRKPMSTPSTESERAASYATYTAYYGRYTIDAVEGRVTHHVEGSANPNWVKTDLVRWFQFSPDGNRLMLSIKNPQGRLTGTLTWERIR